LELEHYDGYGEEWGTAGKWEWMELEMSQNDERQKSEEK
jgi:hypothetical protein